MKQKNLLYQFHEESVNEKVLHLSWFVAHWTDPLGLLLIHLEIELSVEALEVVAGRGAGRVSHPSHPQWACHRYLHTNRIKDAARMC